MKNISTLKINLTVFNPFESEPIRSNFDLVSEMSKRLEVAPSDRAVKNIMDFASSYKVMESKTSGFIELNVN